MVTKYENILPIVTPFLGIHKSITTTIYKNWHTIASDTTPSSIWLSKPSSTYTKPSHSQPSCSLHTNTWLTKTQLRTQILTSKLSYLHTTTYTHTQRHTHRNYTILLSPPNNSTQWTLVILTTWWNSTTSYEDQRSSNNSRHTNMLPVTLVISESLFTFLMEVYFDPLIFLNDLCHYMVFSIIEFPANIYTFITHGLAQASNIHTLLTNGLSPRFYFFSLVPILCTSTIPIHKSYFFPYTVLNTNITFKTNLSILHNTITKFIPPNYHARKTSQTPVRFLHTL